MSHLHLSLACNALGGLNRLSCKLLPIYLLLSVPQDAVDDRSFLVGSLDCARLRPSLLFDIDVVDIVDMGQ